MSDRIVHFEIPYDDNERAVSFYREAFGWNIMPMPEMSYTMVTTGPVGEDGMPSEPGFINGGMFQREGMLTSPVITIAVDDLDAALEKIESLGGKTVQGKVQVGDMGYAGYFTDPEGNLMGLWQNA